jgi:hypothetical protein
LRQSCCWAFRGGAGRREEEGATTSPEDAVIAIEMARAEALTKGDTTAISRMTGSEFFEISRFGTLARRKTTCASRRAATSS